MSWGTDIDLIAFIWVWPSYCNNNKLQYNVNVHCRWYDFHDQGEFVLYRHKTKPIEVITLKTIIFTFTLFHWGHGMIAFCYKFWPSFSSSITLET